MKSPHRTVDLRQANYQVILRKLYFSGPMSRLELSHQTELSPGTVTNITGKMLEEEVVIEKGVEESLGGRPRTILDINPEFGYLVGVDLGETHLQMELFDLTRRKLATARKAITTGKDTPQHYVEAMSDCLNILLGSSGVPAKKILGAGVGVPGIVEHDGRVNVSAPMWDWQPVPLLEMLEEKLGLPINGRTNGMTKETLARNQQAIRELDYPPSSIACGLATQRTAFRRRASL